MNRTRILAVKPLSKGEYKIALAGGNELCTGRTYQAAVERFLECA